MSRPTKPDSTTPSTTTSGSSESNEVRFKAESGQGPFESFIAVAISTILTVLLAWRVLIESERKKPQLTAAANSRTALGTKATQMLSSTTTPYAHAYVNHIQSAGQTEGIAPVTRNGSKSDSQENLSRLSGPIVKGLRDYHHQQDLLSDKVNLSTDDSAPLAYDDFHTDVATPFPPPAYHNHRSGSDNRSASDYLDLAISATNSTSNPIEISFIPQNSIRLPMSSNSKTLEGYESDISASDPGIPQYLDTITEEDTDDINSTSSSSGESDLRSKTLSDKLRDIRARLQNGIESVDNNSRTSSPETSQKSLSVLNRPLMVGVPLTPNIELLPKVNSGKAKVNLNATLNNSQPEREELVDSTLDMAGRGKTAHNGSHSCLPPPLETLTTGESRQLLAKRTEVVGSISIDGPTADLLTDVNFSPTPSNGPNEKPSGPYWDSDDTLSGAESEFDDLLDDQKSTAEDQPQPDRFTLAYQRYQLSSTESSVMEVDVVKQLELKRSYMLTYSDGFPSGMEEFDSDLSSKRRSASSDSSFLRLEAALERDENANLTVMETSTNAVSSQPRPELSGYESTIDTVGNMSAGSKQPTSVDIVFDGDDNLPPKFLPNDSSGEWSNSSSGSEETLTGAKNFAGSQETCIAREGVIIPVDYGDHSQVLVNPYPLEVEENLTESTSPYRLDCIFPPAFQQQSYERRAVCSVCLQSHCAGHNQQLFLLQPQVELLANNTDLGLTYTTTSTDVKSIGNRTKTAAARQIADPPAHLSLTNRTSSPTITSTANPSGIEPTIAVGRSPSKNCSPANNSKRQTDQQSVEEEKSLSFQNSTSFRQPNNNFSRVVTTVSTTTTATVYSTTPFTTGVVEDELITTSPVIVASAVSKATGKDPSSDRNTFGSASANAVSRDPFVALARATASAASQAVSNYQANNTTSTPSELSLTASAAVSFNPTNIQPELHSAAANMSQQRFADRFEQSLQSGRTGSTGLDRNANRTTMENPASFSRSQTAATTTWSTPANQTKTGGIPWGTASIITPTSARLDSGVISPSDSNYSTSQRISMDTPKYPVRVTVKETEKIEVKKIFPPQYLSSDHLQKLLKEPYYLQPKEEKNNRETRAPPATTPVPNDPKPASAPLSERNLQFWSSLPENTVNNQHNLQRWRNSMNLEDEISRNGDSVDTSSPVEPEAKKSTPAAKAVVVKPTVMKDPTDEFMESFKRKYDQPEAVLDEETQSQLAKLRKNKYKAKIDRAKREFLDSKASVSDLYKTPEEFERKFKVPIDTVMRKPQIWRGPLLAKFHSPKFKSSIDVSDIKVNLKAPEPLWDDEYNNIVKKAESVWAAYKKRVTPPKESLFSRHKAFSTGYLETNVDTGEDSAVVHRPVELEVTNMDEVHRSSYSVAPGSQPELDHQSRSRTKSTGQLKKEKEPKDPYSRARSMDYIMSKRGREELEPPENELRKILGADDSHLSEHELRFKKSVEKLHTPDWYFYSDPNKGKQSDLDRRSTKSATSGWRTSPDSSYPNSPEPPETPGFLRQQRPASQPRNFQPAIPTPTPIQRSIPAATPVQPAPPVPTVRAEVKTAPVPKPRAALPINFFDKYKEEIEELRKSRSALHTTADTSDDNRRLSATGSSVPVATVRPQLQQTTMTTTASVYEPNSSFFSDTTITSVATSIQPVRHPRDPLPGAVRVLPSSQHPQNRQIDTSAPLAFDEEFGTNALRTSTPYSSDKLARKVPTAAEIIRNISPRPMRPPPVPPKSQHQIPVAPEERPRPNDLLLPPTKVYAGWTVAAPTAMDLDAPRNRNSRVIEVADTFFESPLDTAGGTDSVRHVTLEEILDSLLGLNSRGTGADHLRVLEDKSGSTLELNTPTPTGLNYSSAQLNPVFVQDSALMQKCAKNPEIADKLLKAERLWVRCQCCGKVREKQHAQLRFVTCKNCYTYYCGRPCRRTDWIYHRDTCNFARINTLCKEVIMRVRVDVDSQWQMSRVARQGYSTRGRGSVNFRFRSPQLAETFVSGGWTDLTKHPGNFLYFFTVQDLMDGGKDRNLIAACRRYDPRAKFILSVSIIADIDDVPETPELDKTSLSEISLSRSFKDTDSWYSGPGAKPTRSFNYTEPEDPLMTYNYRPIRTAESTTPVPMVPAAPVLPFARTVSLPPQQRRQLKGQQENVDFDAKNLLKSVLKSMENIAPDPDNSNSYPTDSSFTRGPARHTVGPTPAKRTAYSQPQQSTNSWEISRSYQEDRNTPVVLNLHSAIADVAESEV